MPVQTNTTALTAMVIGAVPFSVTQDVADQPNTTELWYTYTAAADDRIVGVVAYANIAGVYLPKLYIYEGPASAPTLYHVNGALTRPAYVPVVAGNTYLFRVTQGAVNTPLGDSLTFILKVAGKTDAPADSIIACEESNEYPTPLLDGSNLNNVLFYLENFAIAARGAQMDSDGQLICDDDGNDLGIYDPDLNRIYTGLPSYYGFIPNVCGNTLTKFYLGYVPSFGASVVVRTLNKDGTETSDVWNLPANSGAGTNIAPSRDGTLLYYGGKNSAPAADSNPLHVYDLVNNIALADLVGNLGDRIQSQVNILVFADDSILVSYTNVTNHWYAKRFNASGTLLNTYDFGTWHNDGVRIANDGTSFWIKLLSPTGPGNNIKFQNIRNSDGSVLSEATYDSFSDGPGNVSYRPTYTLATDVPLFGLPVTCTFFVTFATIPAVPTPPGTGTIIITKVTLPVVTTLFDFAITGGLSPATFQLANGDIRTYNNVTPGTYALSETPVAGYTFTYNVSNGSPIGAITVADGETVTVIVTNKKNGRIIVGKVSDPFSDAHVFHFTTRNLTPGTFDLISEGDQTFADLDPNIIYAIEEVPDVDWSPVFLISNGAKNTNNTIHVDPGLDTVVMVLNNFQTNGAGLYEITPGKPTDTIIEQADIESVKEIPNPFFETGMLGDE